MTFTDVSQLAATYPRHAGPTTLYLNFDGGTVPQDPVHYPNGYSVTIRPFEEEALDNTQNRNTDIQDIIFKVSEIFAPFDVQVQRIGGAGNYSRLSGVTTIFIGGNEANSTTTGSGSSYIYDKYSYDETFSPSLDSPTYAHPINSDPYDVAFVDPVEGMSRPVRAAQVSSQFTIKDPSEQHSRQRRWHRRGDRTRGGAHIRPEPHSSRWRDRPGSARLRHGQRRDVLRQPEPVLRQPEAQPHVGQQ